ncbi:MAG TPA: hypothetical protein VEI98_08840 [Xanthobacteraceae bacterium]|nr:hypothetical protein [Xanthobacteraceae bacterium]
MSTADEMAAHLETAEHQSSSIAPNPDDKFDEFDEQLRSTVKDFQRAGDQWKPVEDLQSLLSRIDHHLDYETSERRAIYYRLVAIENGMNKRRPRRFARYVLAICIGAAATLAWQSYGEAAKRIVATRAPELGWSPETKQAIASFIQQLGWTKPSDGTVRPSVAEAPQAAHVAQIAPGAPTTPTAPSLDPEQVHQIALDLAALRQTVERLAAGQDQMTREVEKLQAVDMEILAKTPSPPLQSPAAPASKPTPTAQPSSRRP